MRLTCPDCDAQYDVPDDVIPTSGRDVQCSNCDTTWFQHHPDHLPEEEATDDISDSGVEVDEEGASLTDPTPPPDPARPSTPQPDPAPVRDTPPPSDPTPPPTAAKRSELDKGVANILREEADAERTARRREIEALESQPDLGLGGPADGDGPKKPVKEKSHDKATQTGDIRTPIKEPTGSTTPQAGPAIHSRRDQLPDIEEINSTLRASSDSSANGFDAPEQKRKKRGFRTGLSLMLLLLVIALLIYIFAPALARTVPALDSFLNSYVAWVDQQRLLLDVKVQNLLSWLDGKSN